MIETTFIVGVMLSTVIVASEPNEKGREAFSYATKATYIQSGLDKDIQPGIDYIDKVYIPKPLKDFGIGASVIYRLAKDQRIEFAWSF